MLKKVSVLSVSFAALLGLAACNNDEVESPPPEAPVEDNVEQQSTNNENNQNMAFNFSKFDLDVEYKGLNNDYEVDYENEKDDMEAKIDDEANDNHLKGNEAFDELSSKFEKLTFDQNTSEEDVVKEVAKVFNLNGDYESFELEVRFADGTEKEYNINK
ncbi:YusW family protein [Priestia flexa]|uniref:YusW family protein n=1 Tax=Priestia flexa TaxID=86664 RepID=UPI000E6908E9|nr:YusW family protein [Priestia flexa]RIV04937.1 hypothetical protein D1859_17195 [Priestia flexa]